MPRDGTEIGPSEKKVRRKRAKSSPTPSGTALTSAPIEPVAKQPQVRKRRARRTSTPTAELPGVSPIDLGNQVGGDCRSDRNTQHQSSIAATIDDLRAAHRNRQLAIKRVGGIDRSMESFIANRLGYRIDMDEEARKVLFARAMAFRVAVENGKQVKIDAEIAKSPELASVIRPIIASAASREPWAIVKKEAENEMKLLVVTLPVHTWQKSIVGFGEVSLGALVAEAGVPIGEYRTVSGLWKHMELAVMSGVRQQKIAGHGYGGVRRSVSWNVAQTLIKQQWRGDKDEDGADPKKSGKPVAVTAHALGPYGEIYGRRKVHTFPRIADTADLPQKINGKMNPEKWTPARCNNDALRIMTKALLRDLWRVWNGMPPRGTNPA